MRPRFSILLVRHPVVSVEAGLCYGRSDVSLSQGWQGTVRQWQRIWREGETYRAVHACGVYHSPALRCAAPARAFAAGVMKSASLHADARLLEMDFGRWENRLWADIPRCELDAWAADPMLYASGGGETVQALIDRVTEFWQERVAAAQSCCIVTHGGPLRVMLALAEKRAFRIEDPAPPQGRATLLHFFNNRGEFVARKSSER